MSAEQRQQDRFRALDPANSVCVEACAGSGKTWLLSGRLLRLLLAGAAPGEILAITYTRKAAREIESRLRSLLETLATASEADAIRMLVDRGIPGDAAAGVLPRARSLFETTLHALPPITVTTFHGWFQRLLGGAPLDSGLAGRSLEEGGESLLAEAWAALAGDCARAPEGEIAQSLLWLYQNVGASNTKKLLGNFVERRAEWGVWQASLGGMAGLEAWLRGCFGENADLLANAFAPMRLDELEEFARLLGRNTAEDQALGNDLAQVVVDLRQAVRSDPSFPRRREPCDFAVAAGKHRIPAVTGIADAAWAACFETVRTTFLTDKDVSRSKRKSSAAQIKRLGATDDERFMQLHVEWSERLIALLNSLQDEDNAAFNRHALRVGEALLQRLDAIKRARRVMDFGDLEAEVDALLKREGSGAWLQARLDARYKHILLDEFQDTNPLQWRILRSWLDAYSGAGIARPSVFLVGDPKQSIYRFRRAEPRLFSAATAYFEREFGALRIGNQHTFRSAGGIVNLVNAVFHGTQQEGFPEQSAEHADWPGMVELHPLIAADDDATDDGTAHAPATRRPLQTPRVDKEDQRRASEAALLARRIGEMAGRLLLRRKDGSQRPARFDDVLVLTRNRTHLATYEAALREAGIPFVSPGRGGLLKTLEAADLLAVLRFLADPADNLSLAHTLRTPAFGCASEDLLALSADGGSWWLALRVSEDNARLERAARLLRSWLQLAAYLPAHDLIDRILHESDWLPRTRAAVAPAAWPGIHANLEALLELALTVDAGRYPSLTRFIDELGRRSDTRDEAPDEGLIAATGSGMGRVRIMTVHGSKGLEAPIVWLMGANAASKADEGYSVVLDWPVGEDQPAHFSLLGKRSQAGAARKAILQQEADAAAREELNLLYVAITRAEQVLIVSGIENRQGGSAMTPWQRISAALAAHPALAGGMPELPQATARTPEPEAPPQARRGIVQAGRLRGAARPDGARSEAGAAFGTAMHAWLEAHCAGWPLPAVDSAVEAAARRILDKPERRRLFDPAHCRRAVNEAAFVSADGKAGRIDRWVELDEAFWVIDYKSGMADSAPIAEYRAQVEAYCSLLRGFAGDKPVHGILLFADGSELVLT